MKIRMSAIVLALSFAVAGGASAQETTGTLTGKLTDAQGLALPGATVTVTGTQGERSMVTDADGLFRAPFLVPGVYDVRAEMQGFKAVEQKAIPVSLGQTTSISLQARRRRHHRDRVGRRHLDHRQHLVDHHRRGAVQRTAAGHPGRPPLHRYAVPGAGRQQRRLGRLGQPVDVRFGSGLDNLYVVDGVNITNTGYGAVGSYSIIFGSLGTGDALRLHQGSPGQDRRLRGGVRPVDGRRRQRRHQERHQRPARVGVRLLPDRRAWKRRWKTFQSANGTVNTLGTGPLRRRRRGRFPDHPQQAVLLRRHQPGAGRSAPSSPPTASRCAASARSSASAW